MLWCFDVSTSHGISRPGQWLLCEHHSAHSSLLCLKSSACDSSKYGSRIVLGRNGNYWYPPIFWKANCKHRQHVLAEEHLRCCSLKPHVFLWLSLTMDLKNQGMKWQHVNSITNNFFAYTSTKLSRPSNVEPAQVVLVIERTFLKVQVGW